MKKIRENGAYKYQKQGYWVLNFFLSAKSD